jgi:hypothetical protein
VRNASAVEPEILASVCVPEPGAALACARGRCVSPYIEVESYAGRLQLRQASLLDADMEDFPLVAAE